MRFPMNSRHSITEFLNQSCSCSTLDKDALKAGLPNVFDTNDERSAGGEFFSETPSFISLSEVDEIKDVLHSIRRAIRLPSVKKELLKDYPGSINDSHSDGGVFLSLDFHRTSNGPKLIEINTNAGGAFLQLKLMQAQIKCCKEAELALSNRKKLESLEDRFLSMFIEEWKDNGRSDVPQLIVIVDENPKDQFLYPEFLLFRDLFRAKGLDCEIISPEEIQTRDLDLYLGDRKIDLIYNRLTDFHLKNGNHSAIENAWRKGTVVLTPNPLDYNLYAKKSNLALFSDTSFLSSAGLDCKDLKVLERAIPKSNLVQTKNATDIWNTRKSLFFKPREGFGSKAVYYGGKLTKGKFDEILKGDYICQEFVPPSVRTTSISGSQVEMKMDIRAYIYKEEILLLSSRLYQGQTTNLRTRGGGFSPLYVLPDSIESGCESI